jgi:hypothetical protein
MISRLTLMMTPLLLISSFIFGQAILMNSTRISTTGWLSTTKIIKHQGKEPSHYSVSVGTSIALPSYLQLLVILRMEFNFGRTPT